MRCRAFTVQSQLARRRRRIELRGVYIATVQSIMHEILTKNHDVFVVCVFVDSLAKTRVLQFHRHVSGKN